MTRALRPAVTPPSLLPPAHRSPRRALSPATCRSLPRVKASRSSPTLRRRQSSPLPTLRWRTRSRRARSPRPTCFRRRVRDHFTDRLRPAERPRCSERPRSIGTTPVRRTTLVHRPTLLLRHRGARRTREARRTAPRRPSRSRPRIRRRSVAPAGAPAVDGVTATEPDGREPRVLSVSLSGAPGATVEVVVDGALWATTTLGGDGAARSPWSSAPHEFTTSALRFAYAAGDSTPEHSPAVWDARY